MSTMQPFDVSFSGIHLVEASAGTGKTYNITSLYIRALIELDITVGNILVVTYTEAATKELKDRLLERIREAITVLRENEVADDNDQFLVDLLDYVDDREHAVEQLEKASRTFDEAAIYTIHGFCYQALQEQAFESRAMYDAELIGDDAELVLEAVDDYWRNWVAEASNDKLKRPLLQYLLDNNCDPESLAGELGAHLGQPYLEVHPKNPPSIEDLRDEMVRMVNLFEQLQKCWTGEQEQILELLQADRLNGNKYRMSSLGGWIDQMDHFLSSGTPPLDLFKYFEKFTESTLRESLNKGSTEPPKHPFFELADEYQRAVEPLQGFEISFKKQLLSYLRCELRQKKEDLQVLSYDDLLLRLQESLQNGAQGQKLADKLREKYPLALVDEFQDTDPSQYDIFRRIYQPDTVQSGLFMIGDPKQSIYSFRGADVFSYLKAKRDAPKEQTHGLDYNFRSTPEMIAGINRLFGSHSKPFILNDISFEPVKPGKKKSDYDWLKEKGQRQAPIRFRRLSTGEYDQFYKGNAAEKASKDTAREINRLIEGGKQGDIMIGSDTVKAKDIAVLVRTHRQAHQMSEALREHNIKSVQYSQESVFKSEEARQLQTFLKAIAEPANETLIKTALSLPLTGYQAHQLLEIEEDEARWMQVLDQFDQWHQRWQDKGFAAMFRSVLQQASIAEHLMKYQDGERRLTNLLHLGELLQEEAQQHHEGARGLLKWLTRKRKEDDVQQDEEQLRLESDEELVKIVTMHRSKGLEYPIVFCPYLWHGPELSDNGQPLVYHDPDNLDRTYLDINGKSDPDRDRKRQLTAREELAESLRLAYVAMTRAEQCCYLTWTYAKKSEFSPLGYLLLDPEKVFEEMKQTISDSYNAIGRQPFEKKIEALCDNHSKLFTIQESQPPSGSKQSDLFDKGDTPTLSRRHFKRSTPLKPSYQVSSFSSLTSYMKEDPDMPDYDQFLGDEQFIEPETTDRQERNIFTFPKGPQPGTCIHHIFEEIDFRDPHSDENLITEQLSRYGIDEEWKDVAKQMLDTVLGALIHPNNENLKLQALGQDDLVPELEFYYQTADISSSQLLSIIRDDHEDDGAQPGQAASGFLKGFIDLTFRFEGKFYLLDYKTNYMGDTVGDYRNELLFEEMREASYDLQYHIYTIALHRFLKERLSGYAYEEYFGGAFYLFLRGMNREGREGIFFDRPDFSTIQQLDEYILSGGNHE